MKKWIKISLSGISLFTTEMSRLVVPFLWPKQTKLLKPLDIQISRLLKEGWKKRFSVSSTTLKGQWKNFLLSFVLLSKLFKNWLHFAGEAAEADTDGGDHFMSTSIKQILEVFTPQNIYSADETGIYFCALPDSTYVEAEKKGNQRGFKTANDRATVRVTCNINGDKEKLLLMENLTFLTALKGLEFFQWHTISPEIPVWQAPSFLTSILGWTIADRKESGFIVG